MLAQYSESGSNLGSDNKNAPIYLRLVKGSSSASDKRSIYAKPDVLSEDEDEPFAKEPHEFNGRGETTPQSEILPEVDLLYQIATPLEPHISIEVSPSPTIGQANQDLSSFGLSLEDIENGNFIDLLIASRKGKSVNNVFIYKQEELERALETYVRKHIFEPRIDSFLFELILTCVKDSEIEGYGETVLAWIIGPIFFYNLNRAYGLQDADLFRSLLTKYQNILKAVNGAELYNFTREDFTGDFLETIYTISADNENRLGDLKHLLFDLFEDIKYDPTEIFKDYEKSLDQNQAGSVVMNTYMLIKQSLRNFINQNPKGSDKYILLCSLLKSSLSIEEKISRICRLVLSSEDKKVVWDWIDQFYRGVALPSYNPEAELEESYFQSFLSQRIRQLNEEIPAYIMLVENADSEFFQTRLLSLKQFYWDFVHRACSMVEGDIGKRPSKDFMESFLLRSLDPSIAARLLMIFFREG